MKKTDKCDFCNNPREIAGSLIEGASQSVHICENCARESVKILHKNRIEKFYKIMEGINESTSNIRTILKEETKMSARVRRRLGEIDNMGELSVYGNGYFNVKKQ